MDRDNEPKTLQVRVKEGESGFYGIKLWREGEIFNLVDRYHSIKKDAEGNPLLIPVEQQFSAKWMERMEPWPEREKLEQQPEPAPEMNPQAFSTEPPQEPRPKRKYTRRAQS